MYFNLISTFSLFYSLKTIYFVIVVYKSTKFEKYIN